MPEFPIMPTDTGALLGDTMHLTSAEFGAYVLMLIVGWRSGGSLPMDDKYLSRITRLGRRWPLHRERLLEFFVERGGRLYQEKLCKELDRARARAPSGAHTKSSSGAHTNGSKSLANNTNDFASPTPTQKRDSSNHDGGKDSEGGLLLRPSTRDKVRVEHPGWDVEELVRLWREGTIEAGERIRYPDRAFPAWARVFVKRNPL